MTRFALDSSVAVPLLLETHDHCAAVTRWRAGRSVALSGHALAETYSTLTRLPGDVRVAPQDAAQLLDTLDPPLMMRRATAQRLVSILAEHAITGGAVYDAMVGLAAVDNAVVLASRDERARRTYELVGATVEFVLT